MTSDVAARTYEYISALGRATEPDIERIEYLYKRASRLVSLRRQVERLQDELELELISSGNDRPVTDGPVRDSDGLRRDVVEPRRDIDQLQAEPAKRPHSQPPRSLRCRRP
jgi:hypothetical protein